MMETNPIQHLQSIPNNISAISRGTSRRLLTLGALSLWLVVACIVGAVEYQNRLQYERHATTSAENISQLLEQNITDIILKSDLAIYSVIHEAERQLANGHIDEHSMNAYINWQFSLSPDLDSIRIANADGDISYGIGVFPGIKSSIKDRDYFNQVRQTAEPRLFISSPVIDIGWRASAGEWILWVKDNGIGIAPGDRDRAFQIFQRLVHKDAYEGSGIGLAVCQKIVAGHGGRIWIKSDSGEGTTFIFTLPTSA